VAGLEGPPAIVMVVGGRITRADIPVLCARVRRLAEAGPERPMTCDVGAVTDPDVDTVDALARMQLSAQRLGCSIRLRGASEALTDLLVLAGLAEVLGLCVERCGQSEQREHPGRVEEVREPGDGPA
jgi:anti-anti-sigma regulatory factor